MPVFRTGRWCWICDLAPVTPVTLWSGVPPRVCFSPLAVPANRLGEGEYLGKEQALGGSVYRGVSCARVPGKEATDAARPPRETGLDL